MGWFSSLLVAPPHIIEAIGILNSDSIMCVSAQNFPDGIR